MVGFMSEGRKLNGQHNTPQPPQVQPPHTVMSAETPVAYYTPPNIAITPSSIKWAFAAVVSVLALMPAGLLDRYLMPARQSDMDTVTAVVRVLQQGQAETAKAVERLTVAVDNLSGIVEGVRNAQQAVRVPVPKAKR